MLGRAMKKIGLKKKVAKPLMSKMGIGDKVAIDLRNRVHRSGSATSPEVTAHLKSRKYIK